MARPKKVTEEQTQNVETEPEEVKIEEPKPQKHLPPIIAEIAKLGDDYIREHSEPPTILTLNRSHYRKLLDLRSSKYHTINQGTGMIDKIMGMVYAIDNDEDEMTVR